MTSCQFGFANSSHFSRIMIVLKFHSAGSLIEALEKSSASLLTVEAQRISLRAEQCGGQFTAVGLHDRQLCCAATLYPREWSEGGPSSQATDALSPLDQQISLHWTKLFMGEVSDSDLRTFELDNGALYSKLDVIDLSDHDMLPKLKELIESFPEESLVAIKSKLLGGETTSGSSQDVQESKKERLEKEERSSREADTNQPSRKRSRIPFDVTNMSYEEYCQRHYSLAIDQYRQQAPRPFPAPPAPGGIPPIPGPNMRYGAGMGYPVMPPGAGPYPSAM